MKKTFIGLFLLFFVAACAPGSYQAPIASERQGRAVFTITDAAADMGAVTSVKVTIDSVQVHSDADGWITLNSNQQEFDLLKLKAEGSQALLADANLKPGSYQQMRLLISKVIVTDASGTHEAKLPSGELKIVGGFTVDASATATATFDFVADESLHVTGKGEYILAPVVKLETREHADVDTNVKSRVAIRGGNVKTNVKVGMDENGNIGIGLGIRQDLNLTIEDGKIKIGGLVSSKAKSMHENESAEVEVSVST